MAGYIATAKRIDWNTPQVVVDDLLRLWPEGISLDPCSNETSLVPAARKIALPDDGLRATWAGRVFVNPPFATAEPWMAKAAGEQGTYKECVMLLPVRTDTRAWQIYGFTAAAICFWRGRMRFVGAPASAPFPTALLYWGPWVQSFHDVFKVRGHVVHTR